MLPEERHGGTTTAVAPPLSADEMNVRFDDAAKQGIAFRIRLLGDHLPETMMPISR